MENSALIISCQHGDLNSFAELYKIYSKNALGTAYLIAGSKGIAEDIVQETFIECWKSFQRLQNPATFEVWFYKILVRTGWRMVKRYNLTIPMDDDSLDGLVQAMQLNKELDASETRMTVGQALEKLSLPLKTVVILYYYDDMSIKDIANVLGCLQGTIKSRLHNARKQLYNELYGASLSEMKQTDIGLSKAWAKKGV